MRDNYNSENMNFQVIRGMTERCKGPIHIVSHRDKKKKNRKKHFLSIPVLLLVRQGIYGLYGYF